MNRHRTVALTVAAAAVLACALPACSQPGSNASGQPASAGGPHPGAGYGAPPSGGRGFGRSLTLADYQARFRDRILQADADRDGRVSLAEWTAYRAERRAERQGAEGPGGEGQGGEGAESGRGGDPARQFERMDANRDGYVTPAEIDAVSAQRFARLDANHDGVLTPDERHAMRGGRGGGVMGDGEPTQPLPPPQ